MRNKDLEGFDFGLDWDPWSSRHTYSVFSTCSDQDKDISSIGCGITTSLLKPITRSIIGLSTSPNNVNI